MKSIEDHACSIWLGDLNYRLHLSGKPDEQVWKLIREGHLDKLLEADELCREMAAGRVFKVRVWEAGIMAAGRVFKVRVRDAALTAKARRTRNEEPAG